MPTYIHDATSHILYRLPVEPTVIERKDKAGRRTGWSVTMTVEIIRPDNRLVGSQWEHATSEYPKQELDARYDREQVVSYFLMHHEPRGDRISDEQYRELKMQYEVAAKGGRQA